MVSIRAPARGATLIVLVHHRLLDRFNPRPRTGGDQDRPLMLRRDQIVSIRAPARGATRLDRELAAHDRVSIRAPARGATSRLASVQLGYHVSIRAPARGATGSPDADSSMKTFQSAPPHGGRLFIVRPCVMLEEFQSAPPHGGRLVLHRHDGRAWRVSIRAPARGATEVGYDGRRALRRFNPRPRTGGDRVRSNRLEGLHLAWSLREPCMVVDVTHPCNTLVSSQHLG